jgi:hypothetical protein
MFVWNLYIELFYGCHRFISNEGWFWNIHIELSLPIKDGKSSLFQKLIESRLNKKMLQNVVMFKHKKFPKLPIFKSDWCKRKQPLHSTTKEPWPNDPTLPVDWIKKINEGHDNWKLAHQNQTKWNYNLWSFSN